MYEKWQYVLFWSDSDTFSYLRRKPAHIQDSNDFTSGGK